MAKGPIIQEFMVADVCTTWLPNAQTILHFCCMKANSVLPMEMFTRFVNGSQEFGISERNLYVTRRLPRKSGMYIDQERVNKLAWVEAEMHPLKRQ